MLKCPDRSCPHVHPIERQERQAMKRFAGAGCLAIPPTLARGRVYPRRESNLRTRFRKPLLYPLSYGGSLRQYRRGPAALPTTAHLCERALHGPRSAGKPTTGRSVAGRRLVPSCPGRTTGAATRPARSHRAVPGSTEGHGHSGQSRSRGAWEATEPQPHEGRNRSGKPTILRPVRGHSGAAGRR